MSRRYAALCCAVSLRWPYRLAENLAASETRLDQPVFRTSLWGLNNVGVNDRRVDAIRCVTMRRVSSRKQIKGWSVARSSGAQAEHEGSRKAGVVREIVWCVLLVLEEGRLTSV